jgi:predicted nucleic acid-binding protein
MGKVSAELGQRVYTEANIIIYAVEGFAAYLDQIRTLMTAMNIGEITIVKSVLTLAEVLVKPLKDQSPAIQKAYKTFLSPTPALEDVPINRDILEEAAQWRATTKLKLPDTIHLATALRSKCDFLLTNDDVFRNLGLPPDVGTLFVSWRAEAS